VGPREALRTARMTLREVNWLGDGSIEPALCAGWHDVFVKVRSSRPPQPAWLSRGASGIEVDLVEGEDGVSPGQACVFYDAAQGQARVLGGGFIQSAVAARAPAPAREPAAVAAQRG
jgi:tRNA-specific 2-thiouridylase